MFLGRNTQQKELENRENNDSPAGNTYPRQNTCCIHFEIKSNLGWMEWKDREAALFILLERAFAATKCELEIDDNFETMGMEIEIPYDQEEKFMKAIKSKTLAREIDKIHGIEPALCSWIDAKIFNVSIIGGRTNPNEVGTNSIESIRKRIEMLEKCSESRTREVAGIKEMAISIQDELNKKFNALSHRIDMKVYEKCGKKFDMAELKIMKVLKNELTFLASPTIFKHPPEGIENVDYGTKAFFAALNNVIEPPMKSSKTNQNEVRLEKPIKDQNKYVAEKNLKRAENADEHLPKVFEIVHGAVENRLSVANKTDTNTQEGEKESESEKYLPANEERRFHSLPPPIQIGLPNVQTADEGFFF